jgi:hypothetical protein
MYFTVASAGICISVERLAFRFTSHQEPLPFPAHHFRRSIGRLARPRRNLVVSAIHSPPPQVVSLVLADQVYRDPSNNKCFVLGTYNTIYATSFPCLRQSLSLYAALTDGHGRVPIRLVLTDVDEELGTLALAEGSVEMANPLANLEVVFQLTNVVLPRPGQYRLQLFACGELLRELLLHAIVLDHAPKNDPNRQKGGSGVEEWKRDDTEC